MNSLSSFGAQIKRAGRSLEAFLRPQAPTQRAATLVAADAIASRMGLSEFLPYVDIEDDGIFLTEVRGKPRAGFCIRYMPFLRVGTDAEIQVEGLLTQITAAGATIQFSVLSTQFVEPILAAWASARSRTGGNEAIGALAGERAAFLRGAAHGYSLIEGWGYHPKNHLYFLTVTLPYRGVLDDLDDWNSYLERCRTLRSNMLGALRGMQLGAAPLQAREFCWLLGLLVNPHLFPEEITADGETSILHVARRETRVEVRDDGLIAFRRSDDRPRRYLAEITVDAWPRENGLPRTAKLLCGDVTSPLEHVSPPFWFWLNLAVQDGDDARDRMAIKAAGIARQLISDSPSYRALMSHLVEQQDDVQLIRDALRDGSGLVSGSMGIHLLGDDADALHGAVSGLVSAWKRHGFRASPERYIALPVFLASLPGGYVPEMDPVDRRGGLQRASSMTTRHAALVAPMQTEWLGTPPENGGLLLLSRRGQPAVFNVQDRKAGANYNFVIVAKSGSGKSFVAQELIMDFLAKNGYAFVIDAGRSYYEMCSLLGGTNLVFRMGEPLDLNPFAALTTEEELKEAMEMMRELVRYMAFPQSAFKGVDDWQETIIEHAIDASWRAKGPKATLGDVARWLAGHDDQRAKDIAAQLRPYVEGRFASWFDGTGAPVDLRSRFTVVEMDDLKGQGMFRNVVLTMVMQRIAETMYGLGDASIPKLMMIDEAWDLLGDLQSGGFIERAYRTYRKYGGSAGIITQGFNDLTRSQAAMAAYANSSWLFALAQKAESLDAAFKAGLLIGDEALREELNSVHTAPGTYSEIFVRADTGQGIYRFVADPYTYWLYTTAPDDRAARAREVEAVLSENPGLAHGQALALACRRLAERTARKRYGKTAAEVLEARR
jgi:conjugal transfer ATP-binding protein TraC